MAETGITVRKELSEILFALKHVVKDPIEHTHQPQNVVRLLCHVPPSMGTRRGIPAPQIRPCQVRPPQIPGNSATSPQEMAFPYQRVALQLKHLILSGRLPIEESGDFRFLFRQCSSETFLAIGQQLC